MDPQWKITPMLLRYLQPLAIVLGTIGCLAVTYTTAYADTIVVSDVIPPRNTNWADELVIPAFDPQWGELTAITLTFETPITGSVKYENTSNESVFITSTHAVTASLALPGGARIVSLPSVARIDRVSPFDGVADFGGESGASFEMTTTMIVTQVLTSPEALAIFYGDGPIRFPVTAIGASQILGPGNFDAIFRAQAASAAFTVYFAYRPPTFIVQKLTNQNDASDANGNDVPVIVPGSPVTWTYLVTNTGTTAIPLATISITDSDPSVIPIFDSTSDDGDLLLSPGEVWHYYAVGTALDLQVLQSGVEVVDGCQGAPDVQFMHAYENTVTVRIENIIQTDVSHYCNPTTRRLVPSLALIKLINGQDANQPDDPDTPYVAPGTIMTWTYLITNTGEISFTFAQIQLVDDDPTLRIVFDEASDNGDAILSPGEVWRFTARGIARSLYADTTATNIVIGCNPAISGGTAPAYRNVAVVTVNDIRVSDPAHYCNFPPTNISRQRDQGEQLYPLYLPFVTKTK